MRIPFAKTATRDAGPGQKDNGNAEENDPLQFVYVTDDEDALSDEELDAIGDLGNAEDGDPVDQLRDQAALRAPTRMAMLMARVAESLSALRMLRSATLELDEGARVPEAHWRALADEALGLLEPAAARVKSEQRLMRSMPAKERVGFQRMCDTGRGMALFGKAFKEERAEWEKQYWRRGLDESFGKRPWTGPGGWRSPR